MYTLFCQKCIHCQALVAHTCNPSWSGSRDQEDHSLKPPLANSSVRPYLKKPFTKKDWWSGSRSSPEIKPKYHKKKQTILQVSSCLNVFFFLQLETLNPDSCHYNCCPPENTVTAVDFSNSLSHFRNCLYIEKLLLLP
jgi:hypothetical protein